MNTVIAINGRVYNPVVIDSSANVKTLGANSNYTLGGSEKYVNSGFILPMGQEKGYPGSSNTFTVTFEKAGTYNYLCIIHPWMVGTVIVK
jgi:plastocyanin